MLEQYAAWIPCLLMEEPKAGSQLPLQPTAPFL